MIKKSLKFGFGLGLLLSVVLIGTASADITVSCLENEFTIPGEGQAMIEKGFKGTLIITQPNGDIVFLESGDPIPALASGARIEVFEGEFTVTSGDVKMVLSSTPNDGFVEIKSGSVEVLTKAGDTETLAAGTKFEMNASGETETIASPTADINSRIGTAVEEFEEPDSTNIQQSPSL